jgi:hypothetical protein
MAPLTTIVWDKWHMDDIQAAVKKLQQFSGKDLTVTLGLLEENLRGLSGDGCTDAARACGAHQDAMSAASLIKRMAGQINVVVHALGIVLCLPKLLEDGEIVEYVSLGAGNTGKPFDLETNRRVAEFKFIHWQGGPESIRQNSLFKDFYLLAEHSTPKKKYLYVLGTELPLKFLNGGRAMSSVLSHSVKLKQDFAQRFGDEYKVVRDYYAPRKSAVLVQDVSHWLPELAHAFEAGLDETNVGAQ